MAHLAGSHEVGMLVVGLLIGTLVADSLAVSCLPLGLLVRGGCWTMILGAGHKLVKAWKLGRESNE